MLETVKKQTRLLMADAEAPPFPSLLITADAITAQGPFAEAQAEYLEPDVAAVDALVAELSSKNIGIVAHFYMDPQVQGVLMAAKAKYPHIFISDSLVMVRRQGARRCLSRVDTLIIHTRAYSDVTQCKLHVPGIEASEMNTNTR